FIVLHNFHNTLSARSSAHLEIHEVLLLGDRHHKIELEWRLRINRARRWNEES
ncbi:hypothetical protein LINPERPRIM_LOCUS784, partial [Linum perenne]